MNKTYVGALQEFEQRTQAECPDGMSSPPGAREKWWQDCERRIKLLQQASAEFHDQYTPVPYTVRESMFGIYGWEWGILIPNSNRNPLPKCWLFNDLPLVHFDAHRPLVLLLDQVLHLAAALNLGIQALKDLPD